VAWEIAIKRALGKLSAPTDFEDAIASAGFEQMAKTHSHALATESLPNHHRDPFDRLLVAQARLENCTLVTRDAEIRKYPVPILLA
jgi:PIN domain nuclease of toxin-antitoxin system